MNILIISSGNIVQLAKYARHFAAQGHTVTFINPSWQNRLSGRSVENEFGGTGVWFMTWPDFDAYGWHESEKFDVIFGTQQGAAEMVLKYQRKLGIPALQQILDIADENAPASLQYLWALQEPMRATYPHITALTGINPAIPQQIEELTGRTDCHMVLYPIDTELLDSSPLQPTEEFALIISRGAAYKRVDLAIRACVYAQRPLVLVTQDDKNQSLHKLAEALGARVKFYPSATDTIKANLLRACKMHIFTQMWAEAPCIPSAEALYCNKPSIIFDYPAQRAIEGGFSRYVEPGDFRAMGYEINRVWDNYPAEVECAMRGHIWVQRNTAPSVVAQKILDILLDLERDHA